MTFWIFSVPYYFGAFSHDGRHWPGGHPEHGHADIGLASGQALAAWNLDLYIQLSSVIGTGMTLVILGAGASYLQCICSTRS